MAFRSPKLFNSPKYMPDAPDFEWNFTEIPPALCIFRRLAGWLRGRKRNENHLIGKLYCSPAVARPSPPRRDVATHRFIPEIMGRRTEKC